LKTQLATVGRTPPIGNDGVGMEGVVMEESTSDIIRFPVDVPPVIGK
jgi:hypothetical protein